MNTHELKRMLESNEITRPHFLNIYAGDQLPKERLERDTWLLVCNCCPANLPGIHWIALFKQGNSVDMFDSFGFHPRLYEHIDEFLRVQQFDTVQYNSRRLQSFESNVCGHYCLYFAYYRACGESMRNIVTRLDALGVNSDEHVYNQVVNILY